MEEIPTIRSIDPASGRERERFAEHSPVEAETAVNRAHEAWRAWCRRPFAERRRCLLAAAEILDREREALGRTIAEEMGKPVRQAVAEAAKCSLVCTYYAEKGEAMLSSERVATEAAASYVRFDPLGVLLAIMPWNFPFWQVFRCAAPALMAGNVVLLKHASNVPRCAAAIEGIFQRAGFPPHTFVSLRLGPDRVGSLIAHPLVRAVTLTGSDPAGRAVAAAAGRHLKKVVLELGGSDPFIVLDDAGLEACVAAAVGARMINNGQSCIAAKRFIVVRSVHERFAAAFASAVAALKVGDPLDDATELGPLARADLVDELERQVTESVHRGARVLTGGRRMTHRPGFFFQPTVLAGVAPGMPAYDEELFGPVAALIEAKGPEEALRIANDTPYGLGASLWSADRARAEEMAAAIEAGSVFINGMVKSDPRLPFGGVKMSGFGRELSHFGIREFVNVKTVVVN